MVDIDINIRRYRYRYRYNFRLMHRQVDTVNDTWLVAEPTPLKNWVRQLGSFFSIWWENNPHVPNHIVDIQLLLASGIIYLRTMDYGSSVGVWKNNPCFTRVFEITRDQSTNWATMVYGYTICNHTNSCYIIYTPSGKPT